MVRKNDLRAVRDEKIAIDFTPAARSDDTSLRKASGSMTTPLPTTLVHSGRKTPPGTSCRTNFFPLMMTVCPALWPPAYRATTEKVRVSTSTILPLPSSPHWAPTMTAVLPRLVLLLFNELSTWNICGRQPSPHPGVAHTGRTARG